AERLCLSGTLSLISFNGEAKPRRLGNGMPMWKAKGFPHIRRPSRLGMLPATFMKKLLTFGFVTILVLSVWCSSQIVQAQEQSAKGANSNAAAPRDQLQAAELWRQVEIIRTAHGVPHIRAENLRAAGYALAWLQSEDYGPRTAMNVIEAR